MLIDLAYGRTGLKVNLPDDRTTVIEPAYIPGLPDQAGALLNAIRNPIGTPPLRQMVRPDQTELTFSDRTKQYYRRVVAPESERVPKPISTKQRWPR